MDDTQQRLGALETAMSAVRADVSAIKATLPHLATKADLQQEIGSAREELKERFGLLRSELHTEIGALRSELHTEVGTLRSELRTEIGALRSELHTEIGTLRSELRTEIGALRAEIHGGEKRMIQWFIGTAITLVALVSGIAFGLARYLPPPS